MSEFRLPDPAEIEKLRAEWRREQRGAEVEHNNRRAEVMTMRSQLHLAQQRLEHEVRARRSDAAKASGQVVVLERQLAESRLALALRNKAAERQNKTRVRLSAATTAAAILIAILGWTHGRTIQRMPSVSDAKRPVAVSSVKSSVRGAPEKKEFAHSLNRLDDALAAFPGQSAESVLTAVRSNQGTGSAAPCLLQWNGGQPSLMYSGASLGNSLSATLDHCADAVERYRPAPAKK